MCVSWREAAQMDGADGGVAGGPARSGGRRGGGLAVGPPDGPMRLREGRSDDRGVHWSAFLFKV